MAKLDTKGKLEIVISGVAIVVGLVALYFSWQANTLAGEANRIMVRQVAPQLVILEASYSGGGFHQRESDWEGSCGFTIRVSNLGGATAVTDITAEISYEGKTASVSTSSLAPVLEELAPSMTHWQVIRLPESSADPVFVSNVKPADIDNTPLLIDSSATVNIPTLIGFSFGNNLSLESTLWTEPRSYKYHPEYVAGLDALQVTYSLKAAYGGTITGPTERCWYIRKPR